MIMNGSKYLEIFQDYLLWFWTLHGCQILMHDRTTVHKTIIVQKWLHVVNISVLERLNNWPDFNWIENAYNHKINKEIKKLIK